MKRFIKLILVSVLVLLLGACGNGKPSLDEVEKAIADGTVTVENTFDKGWVDEYTKAQAALSVPAADKTTSNMIGDFETTTQSGDSFTNSDLSEVTFFAFINPNTEVGKEAYNVIVENHDAITEDSEGLIGAMTSIIDLMR